MSAFNESIVEEAAPAWLAGVGWRVRNGVEIAPDELAAERDDYAQVVFTQCLRESLTPLVSVELRLMDAEEFVRRNA